VNGQKIFTARFHTERLYGLIDFVCGQHALLLRKAQGGYPELMRSELTSELCNAK
jgi:hypothetical protein